MFVIQTSFLFIDLSEVVSVSQGIPFQILGRKYDINSFFDVIYFLKLVQIFFIAASNFYHIEQFAIEESNI